MANKAVNFSTYMYMYFLFLQFENDNFDSFSKHFRNVLKLFWHDLESYPSNHCFIFISVNKLNNTCPVHCLHFNMQNNKLTNHLKIDSMWKFPPVFKKSRIYPEWVRYLHVQRETWYFRTSSSNNLKPKFIQDFPTFKTHVPILFQFCAPVLLSSSVVLSQSDKHLRTCYKTYRPIFISPSHEKLLSRPVLN